VVFNVVKCEDAIYALKFRRLVKLSFSFKSTSLGLFFLSFMLSYFQVSRASFLKFLLFVLFKA